MNILSVEASSEFCSAALYTDEHIYLRQQMAPQQHAKLLLNMIDELLTEANLNLAHMDAFAYGHGPGSFTGLRIAASIVQGLAFGVNKVVVPVSTLQAIAQAAWKRHGVTQVFAAIDARMQEIYYGFYLLDHNEIMRNVVPDQMTTPNVFTELEAEILAETWHAVGSGVVAYQELLGQSLPCLVINEPLLYPSALEVAILANHQLLQTGGMAAELAMPVYLRNKVTDKHANLTNLKKGKVIKK